MARDPFLPLQVTGRVGASLPLQASEENAHRMPESAKKMIEIKIAITWRSRYCLGRGNIKLPERWKCPCFDLGHDCMWLHRQNIFKLFT